MAFLTTPVSLWMVIVAGLLALLFLGLWLSARGGGGGSGDADARTQLRAAQNEVRLLKGDAIQTKRDHATEVEKLTKELDTLRAVAGGRIPPELEEWKKRALTAEEQVKTMRERHRAEIDKISAAVGGGGAGGPVDRTVIAPGGVRERMEGMERELTETKRALQAATEAHQAELAALSERLNAEKAAALTAQGRRHAAELEAARREAASGVVADARHSPQPAAPLGADPLAASPAGVADRARFPLLHATAGADQGKRFHLPYDAATIGRSDANTVVIQETAASRTHAEIRFDGADFVLKDQNSTNGTLLNGELVASAPLNFGDVIAIGETQLRFTCEAAEAEATDPAFAERAYEAMIQLAPNCRPALRGLGRLLEPDPTRRDEAQAVAARLAEIGKGG